MQQPQQLQTKSPDQTQNKSRQQPTVKQPPASPSKIDKKAAELAKQEEEQKEKKK